MKLPIALTKKNIAITVAVLIALFLIIKFLDLHPIASLKKIHIHHESAEAAETTQAPEAPQGFEGTY